MRSNDRPEHWEDQQQHRLTRQFFQGCACVLFTHEHQTEQKKGCHSKSVRRTPSAGSSKMRSMDSIQHSRKIRQKKPDDSRLPLPRSHAPKQAGNTRVTCRGIVGRTVVNPPAHNRITSKCMLDVFGGAGSLAKTTDHLGLRGYVLDRHEVLIQI